jgi:prevent-host-death family protein
MYHTSIDERSDDQYSDHMGKRVTATDGKATFLALLDEVEAGEEIEVTRHGRIVARLVPARPGHRLRGMFVGQVRQTVSDDELLAPTEGWFGDDWLDREPRES